MIKSLLITLLLLTSTVSTAEELTAEEFRKETKTIMHKLYSTCIGIAQLPKMIKDSKRIFLSKHGVNITTTAAKDWLFTGCMAGNYTIIYEGVSEMLATEEVVM